MNSTTLRGDVERAGGKIQSVVGEAVGNRDLQAEGATNQATGAVNQVAGQARELVGTAVGAAGDLVEGIGDRLSRGTPHVTGTSASVIAVAMALGAGAYWLFTQTARGARISHQ